MQTGKRHRVARAKKLIQENVKLQNEVLEERRKIADGNDKKTRVAKILSTETATRYVEKLFKDGEIVYFNGNTTPSTQEEVVDILVGNLGMPVSHWAKTTTSTFEVQYDISLSELELAHSKDTVKSMLECVSLESLIPCEPFDGAEPYDPTHLVVHKASIKAIENGNDLPIPVLIGSSLKSNIMAYAFGKDHASSTENNYLKLCQDSNGVDSNEKDDTCGAIPSNHYPCSFGQAVIGKEFSIRHETGHTSESFSKACGGLRLENLGNGVFLDIKNDVVIFSAHHVNASILRANIGMYVDEIVLIGKCPINSPKKVIVMDRSDFEIMAKGAIAKMSSRTPYEHPGNITFEIFPHRGMMEHMFTKKASTCVFTDKRTPTRTFNGREKHLVKFEVSVTFSIFPNRFPAVPIFNFAKEFWGDYILTDDGQYKCQGQIECENNASQWETDIGMSKERFGHASSTQYPIMCEDDTASSSNSLF